MKHDEAIALLREINRSCQNLSLDSILLVKAHPEDRLSVGYQLHIKMALDPAAVEHIQMIAERNCLGVYEEKGEAIIIYKPKPIQA